MPTHPKPFPAKPPFDVTRFAQALVKFQFDQAKEHHAAEPLQACSDFGAACLAFREARSEELRKHSRGESQGDAGEKTAAARSAMVTAAKKLLPIAGGWNIPTPILEIIVAGEADLTEYPIGDHSGYGWSDHFSDATVVLLRAIRVRAEAEAEQKAAAGKRPDAAHNERLSINEAGDVATLDGEDFPVHHDAGRCLKMLLEKRGHFIASNSLKAVPNSRERPDRIIKKLPPQIRGVVESKAGKGIRITIFE